MPTLLFSATVAGDINIKVFKAQYPRLLLLRCVGQFQCHPPCAGGVSWESNLKFATLLFFATINENDNMDTFCGFVAAISH